MEWLDILHCESHQRTYSVVETKKFGRCLLPVVVVD